MAILLVVAYHAELVGLRGGYVGVDVFFVISGFLITGLLWNEISSEGHLSFARFYARRARRLLPAAVLVLLVTLAVARLVVSPLAMPSLAKDALATTLYSVNYRFAATHADYLTVSSPSVFQHYWSLAVEEQFYLVWPLLLLAGTVGWRRSRDASARRILTWLGVVAGASFAASLVLTRRSPSWAFFSLPSRAWELAAGSILALVVPATRRLPRQLAAVMGWAGLAAICWAAVRFTATTRYPGTAALVPIGGAGGVLAAGPAARGAGPVWILRLRPLQRIGRLSYSWYLWHWPVLVLTGIWAARPLRYVERLGLAAASLALAALTLALVEDPVRFAPALARRPRRTLTGGLALTAVAAVVSIALIADVPTLRSRHAHAASVPRLPTGPEEIGPRSASRSATTGGPATDPAALRLTATMTPVEKAISRSLGPGAVPSNLTPDLRSAHGDRAKPFVDGCLAGFADTSVRTCEYGARSGSVTVVLFGDSHATHWFPAVEPAAVERGWRLLVMTKATCPGLDTPVWSPSFGRTYRECDTWRQAAIQRIAAVHPLLVILAMNRNYGPVYHLQQYGPAWLRGMGQTVRTIRGTGAQVVVLGPEPLQAGDVPTCLAEHLDNEAACARPVGAALDERGIAAERRVVTGAGGRYVDLTRWFCVTAGCPVVVGNLLVYRDQNHIATPYASWLAPVMSAQLAALLSRGPRPG